MNTKNLLFLTAVMTFTAAQAKASGTIATGTINSMDAGSGMSYADIYVNSTSVQGTRPTCAQNSANHYTLDLSTSEGNTLLSVLTAIKLAGGTITITSTGTCPAGSGQVESVAYVAW
jgi:hypothetical protein